MNNTNSAVNPHFRPSYGPIHHTKTKLRETERQNTETVVPTLEKIKEIQKDLLKYPRPCRRTSSSNMQGTKSSSKLNKNSKTDSENIAPTLTKSTTTVLHDNDDLFQPIQPTTAQETTTSSLIKPTPQKSNRTIKFKHSHLVYEDPMNGYKIITFENEMRILIGGDLRSRLLRAMMKAKISRGDLGKLLGYKVNTAGSCKYMIDILNGRMTAPLKSSFGTLLLKTNLLIDDSELALQHAANQILSLRQEKQKTSPSSSVSAFPTLSPDNHIMERANEPARFPLPICFYSPSLAILLSPDSYPSPQATTLTTQTTAPRPQLTEEILSSLFSAIPSSQQSLNAFATTQLKPARTKDKASTQTSKPSTASLAKPVLPSSSSSTSTLSAISSSSQMTSQNLKPVWIPYFPQSNHGNAETSSLQNAQPLLSSCILTPSNSSPVYPLSHTPSSMITSPVPILQETPSQTPQPILQATPSSQPRSSSTNQKPLIEAQTTSDKTSPTPSSILTSPSPVVAPPKDLTLAQKSLDQLASAAILYANASKPRETRNQGQHSFNYSNMVKEMASPSSSQSSSLKSKKNPSPIENLSQKNKLLGKGVQQIRIFSPETTVNE